jgi:hypothetical protein
MWYESKNLEAIFFAKSFPRGTRNTTSVNTFANYGLQWFLIILEKSTCTSRIVIIIFKHIPIQVCDMRTSLHGHMQLRVTGERDGHRELRFVMGFECS